jgi:tetratricopeptide (TPR) repeat protein/cold shock CspA family protein
MSDFKTRELEASDLRKAGKFQEALNVYRDLWNDDQDQFNNWSMWGYAKSAQKCGDHDEADRIARACVEKWPDFVQGRQILAWSHYYRHFQNAPPPNQPVSKAYWDAAEDVVTLCADDPHSQYSPCVRVIFTVVKRLEDYPSTEEYVRKRLDWLGHVDPEQLGATGDSFCDAEGKVRKVASDRENWYAHTTRALLDGKRYDDCIAACTEALGRFTEFHYDNDIWFGKRIAEAKAKLGRTEEAMEDYKRLVLKKPEWFLYYDIACLAHSLGRDDEALRNAAEAALARSPLHFKSNLFLLLAVLLRDDGQDDLARQHAQLAASSRSEEGWAPKGRMLQLFEEFGVETDGGVRSKDLSRQLEKHWREWSDEALPRHEGAIDWIHPEKPFGFIRVDGQEEPVFFQLRSFKGLGDRLTGGTRVAFFIKESYDSKKGRVSPQAIEIDPLD